MPDVSELHFTLDSDLLTWDDWIALEDLKDTYQSSGSRAVRDVLARFMVDADGQKMGDAEARAILGKLKVSEIPAAMDALIAAKNKVAALPPTLPGS